MKRILKNYSRNINLDVWDGILDKVKMFQIRNYALDYSTKHDIRWKIQLLLFTNSINQRSELIE